MSDAAGPLPTLELAAAEHLTGLEVPMARAGSDTGTTFGIVRVGLDLAELVDEHGAVVTCRTVGGVRVTWQLQARLALDVYARTYEAAWATQHVVDARLADRWAPTTSRLRIDSWRNESAAAEQPYPNGDLTVISSLWRVSTRQLPA